VDKKFFFLGGMPRSGSTLLASVLAQNPDIHSTTTSGILGMILNVRNHWHNMEEFKALPEEETETRKVGVMRGMLRGYFEHATQPILIDKSRQWVAHLELAAKILDHEPKVIAPVRDLRDCLCSFEKLWRKSKDTRQISQELGNPVKFQTMEGRFEVLSSSNQIVGACYDNIKDACVRGWRKNILFVEYEKFTAKPGRALEEVYDFLGLPYFKHDFENVQQVGQEDDLVYLWRGLHKIRTKVSPQEPTWPQMMPKQMSEFYGQDATFWRKL
jgi:sulfotransferase